MLTVSRLPVSGQFLLSRATFLAAVVATESAAAWLGPLNAAVWVCEATRHVVLRVLISTGWPLPLHWRLYRIAPPAVTS